MKGASHLFIGVFAGLTLATVADLKIPLAAGVLVATTIGSLLPDIDHRNAKINRYTPPGAGTVVQTIIGHRTWTHSLWFVGLLAMLALLPIERWLVVALIVGVVSHLVADAMTAQGIKLLYPFVWVRVPLLWRVVGWLGL